MDDRDMTGSIDADKVELTVEYFLPDYGYDEDGEPVTDDGDKLTRPLTGLGALLDSFPFDSLPKGDWDQLYDASAQGAPGILRAADALGLVADPWSGKRCPDALATDGIEASIDLAAGPSAGRVSYADYLEHRRVAAVEGNDEAIVAQGRGALSSRVAVTPGFDKGPGLEFMREKLERVLSQLGEPGDAARAWESLSIAQRRDVISLIALTADKLENPGIAPSESMRVDAFDLAGSYMGRTCPWPDMDLSSMRRRFPAMEEAIDKTILSAVREQGGLPIKSDGNRKGHVDAVVARVAADYNLGAALSGMEPADVKHMWGEFSDVAIDDDGKIDMAWHGYPAGTDRESIWDDFDAAFPGGLIALDPSLVGAEKAPAGAFAIQTVPHWNANLESEKVDAVLAVPGMDTLLVARGYDEQAGTFERAASYETAGEALHALQPSRFIDTREPDAIVKVWGAGDFAEILAQEGYERSEGNVSELMRQAYDVLDGKLDQAFDEALSQHADFDRLPDQPEHEERPGRDLDDAAAKSDAGVLGLGALADLKGAESGSRGATGPGHPREQRHRVEGATSRNNVLSI